MRTLNIYAALLFSIFAINFSFAQTSVKTETIKVWGNCGMCKNKIEKAAKTGGATTAIWNEKTKILNTSYNSSSTTPEKIQRSIAASGYDTENFKADDKAYKALMGCCKYERNTAIDISGNSKLKMSCKNPHFCKDKSCYKNGMCDENLCKDIPDCKTSCCSKS